MKVHAFVRVNAGKLIEYTNDSGKHKKGMLHHCTILLYIL